MLRRRSFFTGKFKGTKPELVTAMAVATVKKRLAAKKRLGSATGTSASPSEAADAPPIKKGRKKGEARKEQDELSAALLAAACPKTEDAGEKEVVDMSHLQPFLKDCPDAELVPLGECLGYKGHGDLVKSFPSAQQAIICRPCKRVWKPQAQPSDMSKHFSTNLHERNLKNVQKAAVQQSAIAQQVGPEAEQAIGLAMAYAGIPANQMQTALECLSGCQLPTTPPNCSRLLHSTLNALMDVGAKYITETFGSGPYWVMHDCGTVQNESVCILVIQNARASVALPPVFFPSAKTTAVMVREAVEAAITTYNLCDPVCVRSDRGGADGPAATDLSNRLKIIFLPCAAHICMNAGTEWEKELYNMSWPPIMISKLVDTLLKGAQNKKRHTRWIEAQKDLAGLTAAGVEELETAVNAAAAFCAGPEEDAYQAGQLRPRFEKTLPAFSATIALATSLADLLDIVKKAKKAAVEVPENAPSVKRCPLPSATRFAARLDIYEHLNERFQVLYIWVARELKRADVPVSMKKLGRLLHQEGKQNLQMQFSATLKVATAFRTLIGSVINTQHGGGVFVYRGVRACQHALEKLASEPDDAVGKIAQPLADAMVNRYAM